MQNGVPLYTTPRETLQDIAVLAVCNQLCDTLPRYLVQASVALDTVE